ncbi:MAG: MFS transporter [Chloroflexi bacterium]|nr:MFS transporter [Chloroflexota bacterium]
MIPGGAYWSRVRTFSPNARLFLAAATLGGTGAGVAAVLLNLYIIAAGNSEGDLLRILSFGPLGAAAGAILAGPLTDLWGTKRSMLAGTALSGAGALALLIAPVPVVLRSGVALSSLGAAVVYVAYAPFLSKHSTPRERAHLFGMAAAAYVVSTAAGRLAGGFLPGTIETIMPGRTQVEYYRLALLAGVLLSALGLPMLALVVERVRDASESRSRTGVGAAGRRLGGWLRSRLADRRLALLMAQFVVFDGLIRLGANLVVPIFNVYFVRHLGATEAQYGTLAFAERTLVVVAMLLAAPLALRRGPVAMVTFTQLLSVPMLLLLGYAPSLGIAAVALLARGALMEMTVPTRDQFLMEVFPEDARATANATLLMVGYCISFIAHRISSLLLDAGQLHTAFVLTAACYTASALLYWRFFRARPEAAPHRAIRLAALTPGG